MNTALSFPATEFESFYIGRIQVFKTFLPQDATPLRPAIRFCHWAPSGQFALWAGFRTILADTQIAEAKGEEKRPALIFGMHSPDSIPINDDTAILEWPGVKYLRYDVEDTELLAALEGSLTGCIQPLPPHLKPDPKALLKLLAIVRHQFEGEILPVEDRLEQLSMVLGGEPIILSHAEVPQVFTTAQEDMLKRLGRYAPLAMIWAPKAGGLNTFSEALEAFHRQWQNVGKLAPLVLDGGPEAMRAALGGWKEVQLTIEELINSLELLERALKQRLENIK